MIQLLLNNFIFFIFTMPFLFFVVFSISSLYFYDFISLYYVYFNFCNFFYSKFLFVDIMMTHLYFISNLDLFLLINVSIIIFYFFFQSIFLKLIPINGQSNIEMFFNFLAQMIFSQNGFKGQRFFIFFIILFLFILMSNFLGMIPFSFTITSHLFQTFSLGAGVIISITILAFSRNGLQWVKFFFPDLPLFILPLYSFIEIISYISRAFSLAIRLFANLMSGHTLLHILTGFILKIGSKNFVFFIIALIPFFLISAIIVLELVIAILQAYVFVNLFAIYLKDSYTLSH